MTGISSLEICAARDAKHQTELAQLGWKVLVIWECDVVGDNGIADRIRAFLERADD